jgi:hypothetical protein
VKTSSGQGKKVRKLRIVKSKQREDVDYIKKLDKILDDIFKYADEELGWCWFELHKQSGLSYTTVCRLGRRETRLPQFRTIIVLAQTIGWEVSVQKIVTVQKAQRKGRIRKAS